jgi:hypothetical protein
VNSANAVKILACVFKFPNSKMLQFFLPQWYMLTTKSPYSGHCWILYFFFNFCQREINSLVFFVQLVIYPFLNFCLLPCISFCFLRQGLLIQLRLDLNLVYNLRLALNS